MAGSGDLDYLNIPVVMPSGFQRAVKEIKTKIIHLLYVALGPFWAECLLQVPFMLLEIELY